jgi:hypothetical protein
LESGLHVLVLVSAGVPAPRKARPRRVRAAGSIVGGVQSSRRAIARSTMSRPSKSFESASADATP